MSRSGFVPQVLVLVDGSESHKKRDELNYFIVRVIASALLKIYLMELILVFEIQLRKIGFLWSEEIRNNFCFALVIETRKLHMSWSEGVFLSSF